MAWQKTVKPTPGQFILDRGASINRGLVGWWGFNDGGGTRLYDYSGYGNHGTLTNMDPVTDWLPAGSPRGGALDFDGSNDYITTSDITLGPTLAICAWIRGTTGSNSRNYIVAKVGSYELVLRSSGQILAELYETDSGNPTVAGPTLSDEWNHLVMSSDGVTFRLYHNGLLYDSTGHDGTLVTDSSPTLIGGGTSANNCDAIIDNIQIWDRDLVANEVMELFINPYAGIWTPTRTYFVPAAAPAGTILPQVIQNYYRSQAQC